MTSPIPAGYDPQAALDAALFGSGGSATPSDPAVVALETLGGSYGDQIALLQQELQPSTGAYSPAGLLPTPSAGDPAAQFEQTLSGLLGGDAPMAFDPTAAFGPVPLGPSLIDLLA